MVCRECGAYNAEHLTHCRVCAAKLRDSDASAPEAQQAIETQQEEGSRPARDFVQAPSWPTQAFSGASTEKAYTPTPTAQPVAVPAASAVADTPSFAPAPKATAAYAPLSAASTRATAPRQTTVSPQTTVSQQPQVVLCPSCGKPALAGAPFCPYCGQKLTVAAAASTMAAAVAAPVKKAPKHTSVDDDDFDDDEFDDDDDFDDAPKRKKKAVAKSKPKKKGKASRHDDDDDDEFDDDDDDFDDDEFDDDDDFDDEDDEDFDMPRRRGKGTKLLFWGLILLLVALIAIFGVYIVNKNFDGDVSKLFASISSGIGGGDQKTEGDTPVDETGLDAAQPEDLMNTATVTEYTDPSTGDLFYDVDVHAVTGSTIRIVTDAEVKTKAATVASNDRVKLRIAREVFMPNAPCETETVTVTPNIQVDTPTGETIQLAIDDITVTVPTLSLSITDPTTDVVEQTFANTPIVISGTVEDHTVEVYVNGEKLTVYDGGIFNTTYTPKRAIASSAATTATTDTTAADTPAADAPADDAAADDAAAADDTAADDTVADDTAADDAATAPVASGDYPTDDQGRETITIEARKNNYVTARKVITIEPFVIKNMALNVTNDPATGLAADSNGTVTIQGTVTVGAKLVATTDDASDITFGEPTVSETGTFSLAVSVPTVGAHDIKLTATQEGYNETSVDTFVERAPDEKYSAFLKRCTNIEKDYDKIAAGEIVSGNYQDTGKVTEIIASSPYTLYRFDTGDGKTIVCAHRSAKSKIDSGDVGQKKQVIGSLKGLYTDGSPLLWVWFSLNK